MGPMGKFFLPAIAAALLLAGCSRSQDQTPLRMYTSFDPNEAEIYIRAFEADTGIPVKWVRMSSGEVLARVKAEAKNPQMGLWLAGTAADFTSAKKENLLAPYAPQTDFTLEPHQRDPAGYWTGFYFGVIGFASNTKFLAEHGLSPPSSWQDLLKPEWQGQIGLAYPYTSSTAYTLLASLVTLMGEDQAFEYLRRLDRQVHHYNKSGSACVTQVGLGELGVGIAFAHDILTKGVAKGYPVTLSFPAEGSGYEIGAMALIRGGPDHEPAQRFMDWMLSERGQNLMQQWHRVPLHPRAQRAALAVGQDQARLIHVDIDWAGQNRDRLIGRWRETKKR